MNTPPTSPTLPLQPGSFGGHNGPASSSSLQCLLAELKTPINRCPSSPCSLVDFDANGDGESRDKELLLQCMGKLDFMADPSLKLSVTAIGHGSYSYVYEIVGKGLAIKFPQSRRKSKLILAEATAQARLSSCSHVVPLMGISYINRTHFRRLRSNECVPGLIMPRFKMNLQQFYLGQDDSVVHHHWWKILYQMLNCLKGLREHGYIHGDIKTANILVDFNEDPNFFLADFTSAKRLADDSDGSIRCSSIDSTMEYCAPETLRDSVESFDTDLYALGLCLLALITKNEPYQELQKLKNHGTGSIQQSQWLMNAILKEDPINMNLINTKEQTIEIWSKELSILSLILVKRLSLDECLDLYKRINI